MLPAGVKFKIAVPEGKGPGDIIRASVPISGEKEKKHDTEAMVYESNGGNSGVPPPRPRRPSTQHDSHSGSPAPPRRRTSISDSPRPHGSPAGSGRGFRGDHEVDVGGDYSFTPEQTRAQNARRFGPSKYLPSPPSPPSPTSPTSPSPPYLPPSMSPIACLYQKTTRPMTTSFMSALLPPHTKVACLQADRRRVRAFRRGRVKDTSTEH